ncbi:hypothetical protein AAHB49_14950 [Bacillus cereus]
MDKYLYEMNYWRNLNDFSQSLRKEVDSIWGASFHHPFIKKLGEGTLDLARFRYYVLQDSYYLSHFARVQTLGAAKALELETTARMAHHAQNTYEAELSLHENFGEETRDNTRRKR